MEKFFSFYRAAMRVFALAVLFAILLSFFLFFVQNGGLPWLVCTLLFGDNNGASAFCPRARPPLPPFEPSPDLPEADLLGVPPRAASSAL